MPKANTLEQRKLKAEKEHAEYLEKKQVQEFQEHFKSSEVVSVEPPSVVAEQSVSETPKEQKTGGVRRKRANFNGTTLKLGVNVSKLEQEGFHCHIINDIDNRINEVLDRGYEFVLRSEVDGISENVTSRNTDLGDKVRFLVGTQKSGEPLYAYLMKQKQEWYEEDQQIIQNRNDEIDANIRNPKTNNEFYVRPGGIEMKN